MNCPKCNGKGRHDVIVSTCSTPTGECCGGCEEEVKCDLCVGSGHFGGDLFELYDEFPEYFKDDVHVIVEEMTDRLDNDGLTYKDCNDFLDRLKPLGFEFDYGLDCTPYKLREI